MTTAHSWIRAVAWAAFALASAAAFVAYLRPDFVVDLAQRMFLCS